MIESIVQDCRHGVRVLAKTPGFSLFAIAVLGLGIGANTAIFSVVNAVLLRPLPFPDADRIVRVWHVPPPDLFPGMRTFSVSPANYLDWRAQSDLFERMAAYTFTRLNLTDNGEPEAIAAEVVASDFFAVLGVQPIVGRTFVPDEEREGRDRAVILSYPFWQTRFGGERTLVGRQIHLNGVPYTVVGIMPERFDSDAPVQAWVPLAWTAAERAVRGIHDYSVIGRLKPGATVAQAQSELTTISTRLERQYPTDDKGWGALVVPLQEDIVGQTRPALLVLLGAVVFVLLIACANLANLLLAKTLARGKEIAVRTALGASRARIVRQMLCETLLLAAVGGAVGVLLARWGVGAIARLVADSLPRAGEIAVDGRVLAFAAAVSVATGVAAGLAPAWRLARADANEALKQELGRGSAAPAERRTRSALVGAEIALALVLLLAAGLLIRSLWLLQRVDPGINPSGVITMTLTLPQTRYPQPAQRTRFFTDVLDRVRTLPGVEAAGAINSLPMTGGSTQPVAIEGRPAVAMSEQPEVAVRVITPGYLRASGMRLVAGRDVSAADAAERPSAVLVSEAMARRFWPGESAIGKRLTLTFTPGVTREVVGVVNDVKLRGLDVKDPIAALYAPLAQMPMSFLSLVVRTTVPPTSVVPAMTRAVHEIDRDEPVLNVRTLDDLLANSLAQRRFSMLLLSGFAAAALLLSAIGIYGVLSYSVRQRVREIGIRMALGAPHRRVVGAIVAEGLKPTLAGVIVGAGGAIAIGRLLETVLYGVSAHDATTFVAVVTLVVVVGVAATLVPAYRATRVDPLEALRHE